MMRVVRGEIPSRLRDPDASTTVTRGASGDSHFPKVTVTFYLYKP